MDSNRFIYACLPDDFEDGHHQEWMDLVHQLPCGRYVATNGHIMGIDHNYTGYSTKCEAGSVRQIGLSRKIDQDWIKSETSIRALDAFFMPFTDQIEIESLCVLSFMRCGYKVLAAIQRKYLLLVREAIGMKSGIHYLFGAKVREVGDFLVYNGPLKFEPTPCEFSSNPIQRSMLIMTVSLDNCLSNVNSLKNWKLFDEMVQP